MKEARQRSAESAVEPEGSPWLKEVIRIWPLVLGFVATSGVALHLSGYIAYREYLGVFGLDPEAFPREHGFYVVNGYYGFFDRVAWLINHAFSLQALVLYAIMAIVICFLLTLWRTESKPPPSWFRQLPAFIRTGLTSLLVAAFVCCATLIGMMVAAMILIIPGAAGEEVGRQRGQSAAQCFMHGCSKAPVSDFIFNGGESHTRGYVVAIANDAVAYYDVDLKKVRLRPRDGLEIQTPLALTLQGAGKPPPAEHGSGPSG